MYNAFDCGRYSCQGIERSVFSDLCRQCRYDQNE